MKCLPEDSRRITKSIKRLKIQYLHKDCHRKHTEGSTIKYTLQKPESLLRIKAKIFLEELPYTTELIVDDFRD
ncbi:hypothetical protein QR680_011757 [Steinernema hermaphroditum]|uniref:Uncharacterized protein n=1 Tax=Steinernema hermaphroditum TaxID=289476 RepID=A0AA39LZ96_9BILA|nr:hypothetical protein QR680_011757 [Steinernema hermaphroditum]